MIGECGRERISEPAKNQRAKKIEMCSGPKSLVAVRKLQVCEITLSLKSPFSQM